mmetsp:Transcript_37366/g.57262  ORF Transcript_37366/g.57262 Transcript_37366/m.57262 type:complete len:127 (-) Transcript_37366:107-487(-)|eukprot:CAMPEP_0170495450 /NCGR_PEP_ID=MMETSP0208-20121228/16031_1 /TAXON_ID=197538 /ORGANISM="Strombidium inclinatum, Strain S3" /LENGTH=126 /DNA_ID=CAMNT_0010771681 /DNA_START=615 /DNA_END=995 /DNA_ORIENTATION=-
MAIDDDVPETNSNEDESLKVIDLRKLMGGEDSEEEGEFDYFLMQKSHKEGATRYLDPTANQILVNDAEDPDMSDHDSEDSNCESHENNDYPDEPDYNEGSDDDEGYGLEADYDYGSGHYGQKQCMN